MTHSGWILAKELLIALLAKCTRFSRFHRKLLATNHRNREHTVPPFINQNNNQTKVFRLCPDQLPILWREPECLSQLSLFAKLVSPGLFAIIETKRNLGTQFLLQTKWHSPGLTFQSSIRELDELEEAYAPFPSFDDMAWYGLAYTRVYEIFKLENFLRVAKDLFNWCWNKGKRKSERVNRVKEGQPRSWEHSS